MSRLILHLLGLKCLVEQNHINFGGSGVVIYKTPEDSVKSGVKIGGYFLRDIKATSITLMFISLYLLILTMYLQMKE